MPTEEERKAAMELDAREDDSSGVEDDAGEAEQVETLVAGRSKRATAGNRMSSMVAEIAADDELELLFADDEEAGPDEEFEEDADEAGSDNDLGESSDDEDRGPAVDGDDLDGEKEIEKQARDERKRKRKAQQSFTRPSKKIKVVPLPGTSKAAPPPKPSKKIERTTWIPANEATRYSRRGATALQAEVLRSRIEAREEERKAQAHKLEAAARKREAARAKTMTQEEHLAEAAQVAKENSRSLNRWEAEERERQEEQKARLAALQNRRLTGPVIQYWSGPARWLGDKLSAVGMPKIKEVEQKEIARAERDKEREEKQRQKEEKERQKEAERKAAGIVDLPMDGSDTLVPGEIQPTSTTEGDTQTFGASMQRTISGQMASRPKSSGSTTASIAPPSLVVGYATSPTLSGQMISRPKSSGSTTASIAPPSLVAGYVPSPTPQIPPQPDAQTAQSDQATPSVGPPSRADSATPAPPTIKRESSHHPPPITSHPNIPPSQQVVFSVVEPTTSVTHTPAPQSTTSSTLPNQVNALHPKDTKEPVGPPAPPPLPEIATRVLICVLNVELSGKNDASVINSLPAELRDSVLVSKGSKAKRTQLKAAPTATCMVTGQGVGYKDPATGVGYHNTYAYRQLQKLGDGRSGWSQLAGSFLGGGSQMHAQGIPERFAKTTGKRAINKDKEGEKRGENDV